MTEAPLLPLDEQPKHWVGNPDNIVPCDALGPNGECATCIELGIVKIEHTPESDDDRTAVGDARDSRVVSGEPEHNASGSPPSTMLALIDRYVCDPSVDVEKFERLLAMKERMDAREAELAFNESKARIKKRLQGIRFTKTKSGPDNAYRYMPLDKLDEHLAPLLAEESMDLSFTDELLPNGWLLIRGRLKHLPRGHYEDSTMPAPPDTVNKMKSAVQAIGSTNSFLRRYVTVNIFNIVVIGDDNDGNNQFLDEAQIAAIVELMAKAKAGPKFLQYMKALSVEEAGSIEAAVGTISARSYQKAISTLNEQIQKRQATA